MKLESINCNQCGAPLEVPESANYVKCNHCQAQLTVKRTASATFTEHLDQLDRKTDAMRDQLQRLVYENRLASIDRSWEREKQQYMIRSKNGQLHEPSEAKAILVSVVLGVIGAVITIGGLSQGGPGAMFGLLFIGIAIVGGIYHFTKASNYRAARRRYRMRRRNVTLDSISEESPDPFAQLDDIRTPQEYLKELQDEA